ncbi:mitogen-activated kinase-binding 1-like isoform X3 [Brachionus plicatilis]|uniref:Mitogen-activated kinase-binding 1-like isoform X3 n=1 Tax=Brachionus plicatilis TaxID=10195 RepID=A0A3M7TA86_BRAPC|nr:mitogen-activated kinase-binding 1-like isoform X3 [Brachionus plicatilis]
MGQVETGSLGQNVLILNTLKRRGNKSNSVPLDERVSLERVYGLTSTSNSRLAQSIDGTVAYLAGCVIVLYYPCWSASGKEKSNEFIISGARKTLTTVGFSADGRLIGTGESGHEPRVRVWDVKEKVQIGEFAGHKFSIECVYFSPNVNSNLLVSIGSQHDMVVNVWNLKSRFKAASNKISCKVKGMSFARDASYFVTVGNRHVKFWYLTTSVSVMETVPLKGRAAILGEYKNSNGVVCEFNENRCLSRAIDLRVEHAYCLYADHFSLFVGCCNGDIHLFKQKHLQFVSCLPRPHYLGVDISQGTDTSHVMQRAHNTLLKYPDCVAMAYNKQSQMLTAIYNDHSLYTWHIGHLNQFTLRVVPLWTYSRAALGIHVNNVSNTSCQSTRSSLAPPTTHSASGPLSPLTLLVPITQSQSTTTTTTTITATTTTTTTTTKAQEQNSRQTYTANNCSK